MSTLEQVLLLSYVIGYPISVSLLALWCINRNRTSTVIFFFHSDVVYLARNNHLCFSCNDR